VRLLTRTEKNFLVKAQIVTAGHRDSNLARIDVLTNPDHKQRNEANLLTYISQLSVTAHEWLVFCRSDAVASKLFVLV